MARRIQFSLIVVANLAITATAWAGDKAVLSTARELAKQGLQAYDAGRYDEAVEKLSKAYEVVHVPTLAVNEARALVKLGKLVAASELYLEATRIPKDKSWQSTQDDAQRDAEKERNELLARIPRLKIIVKGVSSADVSVKIDGAAVPQALMDADQLVDPGERRIEGAYGNKVVKQSIVVKESDYSQVTLQFAQQGVAATPILPSVPNQLEKAAQPSTGAVPMVPAPASDKHSGGGQKVVGWLGVSVGAAGLVVGATSGILANSKRSSLLDSNKCSADKLHCSPDLVSDVNAYNSLRTVSTIGFVAGGVLAAAGVTLILTAPKQESSPPVGLWLGPSGAGVYGGF
jgi:phage gp36-like protein